MNIPAITCVCVCTVYNVSDKINLYHSSILINKQPLVINIFARKRKGSTNVFIAYEVLNVLIKCLDISKYTCKIVLSNKHLLRIIENKSIVKFIVVYAQCVFYNSILVKYFLKTFCFFSHSCIGLPKKKT